MCHLQRLADAVVFTSTWCIQHFVDWPHSCAVVHCSGYIEPVCSSRLDKQQQCACCEGHLSVSGGIRECRSLSNEKTSHFAKN
jgi:hypothetical protein